MSQNVSFHMMNSLRSLHVVSEVNKLNKYLIQILFLLPGENNQIFYDLGGISPFCRLDGGGGGTQTS